MWAMHKLGFYSRLYKPKSAVSFSLIDMPACQVLILPGLSKIDDVSPKVSDTVTHVIKPDVTGSKETHVM